MIDPLFTADAISARVREPGAEIRSDAGTSEVFLLCILKGASLAFTIEDGTFARYGLEHERRFGNVPFIGRVN